MGGKHLQQLAHLHQELLQLKLFNKLWQIESGRKEATPAERKTLAAFFRVPEDYLFRDPSLSDDGPVGA